MLRLQAERPKFHVFNSTHSNQFAIHSVGGVKLNPRFGREHFYNTPGLWLFHSGGQFKTFSAALQNIVVIITPRLRFELIDPFSDRVRLGEIEWSAFDRSDFAGRN